MLKFLIVTTVLFPGCQVLWGQVTHDVLLVTKSKSHLNYIQLDDEEGEVFEMGYYMGRGGGGYSIISQETLRKQADGSGYLYAGATRRVMKENGKLYLVTGDRKRSSYRLDTASNISAVYRNLNNAYWLDKFFSISRGSNNAGPLSLSSFTQGLATWRSIDSKEMRHADFRLFADARLAAIRDSVRSRHNHNTLITQLLLDDIKTISFDSLNNGLLELSSNFTTRSGFFSAVMVEVGRQRPAHFFKLAENYRQHKSLIFASVQYDKQAMESITSYQTDSPIKKEFLKLLKYEKTIPYRVIGTYAVVIGVITFLLVRD